MPISTPHPEWEEAYQKAELTEDAFEGDVKKYVPRLAGQSNDAYDAYVNRAAYYNVTERTTLALIGALMRKPYTLDGVQGDEPATDHTNFAEFVQSCYLELMQSGRVGILVDYDNKLQSPKLVAYCAEDVINWCEQFIVIKESTYVRDEEDPYKLVAETTWRELRLDETGLYEVRLWKQKSRTEWVIVDVIQPTIRGQRLGYIPFYWTTPYDNSENLYNPPLYNLAELNVQHFKVSTDYSHGLHFLALPTPWIAGEIFSETGHPPKNLQIGSETFINLVQGSSIGFLEFSGAGLSAIASQLKSLEEQMFNMGSRLLMQKKGIESAEALQIRAGSEGAVLETMTNSLENCLQAALATYNQWAGSSTVPTVSLNRDFTSAKLDAGELKALLEAYAAGVITLDTMLQQMFQGEIVADPAAEKAQLTQSTEPEAPPVSGT